MVAAARRMLVILAALFLSAGHAACACAAVSTSMAPVVEAGSAAGHAHHQADVDGDGKAPAPALPECSHCKSVALAGDGSVKSAALPAFQKNFAIVASTLPSLSRQARVSVRAQRLHWAAPPRGTPVSLKIRLRN